MALDTLFRIMEVHDDGSMTPVILEGEVEPFVAGMQVIEPRYHELVMQHRDRFFQLHVVPLEPHQDPEWIKETNAMMAHGALESIHEMLDQIGVPRSTWADDHVINMIVMYNWRGTENQRLRRKVNKLNRYIESLHKRLRFSGVRMLPRRKS